MRRKKKCRYLPEVRALWDGELAEARTEAVLAHLAGCPVCRQEQRALERLSALLQASALTVPISPERHQRLKEELLERCARSLEVEASRKKNPHGAAAVGLRAWWLRRLRFSRSASTTRRRAIAALAPIAATVLLFVLLTIETPAGVLAKSLHAMANVKSAHAVGWHFSVYRTTRPNTGRPLPGRMRLEYWYKAPDKFRSELLPPEVRGWGLCPHRLVVHRDRAVIVTPAHKTATHDLPEMVQHAARARVLSHLTPFDFFSPEGFITRASREKKARITRREGRHNGRRADIVSLEMDGGEVRHRWVLYIDPATDLILRSEYEVGTGTGASWRPLDREILERFEYNVPVSDALFDDLKKPGIP